MNDKIPFRVRFQVYTENHGKPVRRKNLYIVEWVVYSNDEQAAVMEAAYNAYTELKNSRKIEMLSCEDITMEVYK